MRRTTLLITLCLAMITGAASAQEKPKDGYFTTKDGSGCHPRSGGNRLLAPSIALDCAPD
jgi:hypothetical protein